MFVKINDIFINPESGAVLKVEQTKGRVRDYHVQFYTAAGHNLSITGEYKERKDAEKELNRVASALSTDTVQGNVLQLDATKDTAIEDLTQKLDELTIYTKNLEKDLEEQTKALAEAEKTIGELNEKIAGTEKESKKGGK